MVDFHSPAKGLPVFLLLFGGKAPVTRCFFSYPAGSQVSIGLQVDCFIHWRSHEFEPVHPDGSWPSPEVNWAVQAYAQLMAHFLTPS